MDYNLHLVIVVDPQIDFVAGSLGSEEAKEAVKKIAEKIDFYNEDIRNCNYKHPIYIFTRDTHNIDSYFGTIEGSYLPVAHCFKNTPGWCFVPELYEKSQSGRTLIVEKETFGINDWRTIVETKINVDWGRGSTLKSIEVVGLDTDFCVMANAFGLKAAFPNVPITIDAECCAGSTPEMHEKALDMLEHCHFDVKNRNK